MLSCPRCPVVKCVRHRGDVWYDVCCSVVFGTLVGVFVFSVMWSELLMTSAISPLWSSVYECQRVECAFTSPVRTRWMADRCLHDDQQIELHGGNMEQKSFFKFRLFSNPIHTTILQKWFRHGTRTRLANLSRTILIIFQIKS